MECRREVEEIDRLEQFLEHQQKGDATSFLFNWSRHQQARSELTDFGYFRTMIDVQLDAKMTGSVSIITTNNNDTESVTNSAPVSPVRKLNSPVKGTPNRHLQVSSLYQSLDKREAKHPVNMKLAGMKKVQRRTSDFFAETLSFDAMSLDGQNEDYEDAESSFY